MNKKQLIIAAMAAVLSVSAANASEISGITGVGGVGTTGSFDIKPENISGDVGYRYYDKFNLTEGDIANLIFQGRKGNSVRDIEAFINLVQNKIDINGVVNTMRNGNFHNGHAIFVSPNGMTVGASGVLNVGTLSVVTPTTDKFDQLKADYAAKEYTVINNISQMRNGKDANYGGNAAVNIAGTVLARNGVDIRGSQVNISGNIANGLADATAFTGTKDGLTASQQAKALFDTLVNTDGIITADASKIAADGGRIVIKSGAGNGGININGTVANLTGLESAITNHGNAGLTVAGKVATNGKLNVYNNNTVGALNVSGKLTTNDADMSLTSKGGMDVKNTAVINTDKNLEVVNNGGKLVFAGNAVSKGKTDIVNRGNGGMEITGTVGDEATPTVRIVNENGKLAFAGTANAAKSVSVRNWGTQGMEVNGTINAGEGVLIHNKAGNASIGAKVNVEAGNVQVYNQGTGKLTTTEDNEIINVGNVAIKNEGKGGMELNGSIANEGEVAINNLAGAAVINGFVANQGNMGIINKEHGTGLTIGENATILNEGKLKLVNSTGAEGLTIDGNVINSTGNTYLYNDAGHLTINGGLGNLEAGNVYVMSRNASTGITTGADSIILNEAGNVAIKHDGTGAKNGVGMDLNGTIQNASGETAINNYKGNMHVAGKIETEGRNLGIINRAGGNNMLVEAEIKAENNDVNIKNYGTGNMTVNGEITHNGRLNVLANEGNLTLGGKIHNNGKDMTYAAARANGDGIVVTKDFAADSTNGGTILIKNITGQNGLTYEGTMTSTNGGQAEVYNKAGNMTVNGNVNGTPAVVLNTGKKLTVTEASNLQGDVKIVNKGTVKADVADRYKDKFREKLNDNL